MSRLRKNMTEMPIRETSLRGRMIHYYDDNDDSVSSSYGDDSAELYAASRSRSRGDSRQKVSRSSNGTQINLRTYSADGQERLWARNRMASCYALEQGTMHRVLLILRNLFLGTEEAQQEFFDDMDKSRDFSSSLSYLERCRFENLDFSDVAGARADARANVFADDDSSVAGDDDDAGTDWNMMMETFFQKFFARIANGDKNHAIDIDFTNIRLGDKGVLFLARMINDNPDIKVHRLRFVNVGLSDDGFDALCSMDFRDSLAVLDINNNTNVTKIPASFLRLVNNGLSIFTAYGTAWRRDNFPSSASRYDMLEDAVKSAEAEFSKKVARARESENVFA